MAVTAGYVPLIAVSADDSTYNIIGGVNSLTFDNKRTQLDVSEQGVAYQKVISGLKKGRTVTLSGAYATADTGQARVRTLFGTGAVMYTQIAWDGTTGADIENFNTKVKGYSIKTSTNGLVTWDVDLVVHGLGDATHHAEAAYTAITPIAGYTSRITVSDTVGGTYYDISGATEATLKVERAMLEGEDFESTYTGASVGTELHTAGIYKGSLSFAGYFEADTNGQAHIRSGLMNRADRFVKFLTDGTNGWILQTLFTDLSLPNVDPKSENKFSASGQFITLTATP